MTSVVVTRSILYIASILLNLLPCIRHFQRIKNVVNPETILELNVLITNILDSSLFMILPTITESYDLPLHLTLRQANQFQPIGCDVGERMVVLANMCLYQHIAAVAITNMLALTFCIYSNTLQAPTQILDKHKTASFVILSWTLSVLLTW